MLTVLETLVLEPGVSGPSPQAWLRLCVPGGGAQPGARRADPTVGSVSCLCPRHSRGPALGLRETSVWLTSEHSWPRGCCSQAASLAWGTRPPLGLCRASRACLRGVLKVAPGGHAFPRWACDTCAAAMSLVACMACRLASVCLSRPGYLLLCTGPVGPCDGMSWRLTVTMAVFQQCCGHFCPPLDPLLASGLLASLPPPGIAGCVRTETATALHLDVTLSEASECCLLVPSCPP